MADETHLPANVPACLSLSDSGQDHHQKTEGLVGWGCSTVCMEDTLVDKSEGIGKVISVQRARRWWNGWVCGPIRAEGGAQSTWYGMVWYGMGTVCYSETHGR